LFNTTPHHQRKCPGILFVSLNGIPKRNPLNLKNAGFPGSPSAIQFGDSSLAEETTMEFDRRRTSLYDS
jgi:hypothetical protein